METNCNKSDCGQPISGAEYGLTIADFKSKKSYLKALQEYHDEEAHTTLEEQLKCDECDYIAKDLEDSINHLNAHMKMEIEA